MSNIVIVEGNFQSVKSDSTDHVDILLKKPQHYVNVILPDGLVLQVEASGVITKYEDDNIIGTFNAPKDY